jgi:hypothetical protein
MGASMNKDLEPLIRKIDQCFSPLKNAKTLYLQ